MAKFNQFKSENFGLSILGHLVVLGLFVFLADVIIDPTGRFVAPDHIEITMIDLSSVRITGDKSKIYNTNVPEKTESKPTQPVEAKPKPKENDILDKKPIEKPTLVPEEEKKPIQKKENNPKDENPDDNQNPTSNKVIRVKRNTPSLDRSMSLALRDALRTKMTGCWVIDNARPDLADIRAVAHLKLRKNGTVSEVWFESAARAEYDTAFSYVLDTIRQAINVCQPFDLLPVSEYEEWREIQFTFYPTQGVVM